MPDTVSHLGVLDGNNDPFRFIENMSVFPCAGRKADVTGACRNCLAVGIGHKVPYVFRRTFFLIADLVTVGIVRFIFHVTPHISGLPNVATPSKSYFA